MGIKTIKIAIPDQEKKLVRHGTLGYVQPSAKICRVYDKNGTFFVGRVDKITETTQNHLTETLIRFPDYQIVQIL